MSNLKMGYKLVNSQTGKSPDVRTPDLTITQGSARHKIVTKNLNEAIDALSHGEVSQAKTLIEQTISQLDQYQSRFFQTKMPERAILQEIYGNIDRSIADKRSQMEL